jgi:hypothetical protein
VLTPLGILRPHITAAIISKMPKAADPVVIPPMAGIDGKFSCIGNGLLYDGHARDSPEALRVLLTPNAGGGQPISGRARYVYFACGRNALS